MKVLVIGGGPAGLAAALQARELGAEVTLIEARRVGGTSLNDGPAPVRTLARAARLARDAASWPAFGLRGAPPEVDIAAALANAERVARYAHEHKNLAAVIRAQGIELVDDAGPARFTDPHTVETPDGRTFRADSVIVTVGGRSGRIDVPGVELALTYEDVRSLPSLPESVAVVGGADTGCQLASILADFGARVTLIEAGPALVPRADPDTSRGLLTAFRDRGMTVALDTALARLEPAPRGVVAHTGAGQVAVEAVFLAVGWPANTDTLGTEAAGIELDRGYVKVDAQLRTNVPHVYAAGDVNGLSMLVPSARHEGRVAAQNAVLGTRRRFTHDVVPTGSFTDPEYGSVGMTEPEARAHHDCEVAVVRYEDLLRPVADGRSDGFCKLIVDAERHHVLGAHVLGEYSVEVVQTVAACMAANMRVEQIAEMQFAFPTFTEAVTMAAQTVVRQLGLAPMAPTWSDTHRLVDPERLR